MLVSITANNVQKAIQDKMRDLEQKKDILLKEIEQIRNDSHIKSLSDEVINREVSIEVDRKIHNYNREMIGWKISCTISYKFEFNGILNIFTKNPPEPELVEDTPELRNKIRLELINRVNDYYNTGRGNGYSQAFYICNTINLAKLIENINTLCIKLKRKLDIISKLDPATIIDLNDSDIEDIYSNVD